MTQQLVGLLGGTFDPIHNGHLYIAQQLLQQLPLDYIEFIPCNRPSHRTQPYATGPQRLAMVQLALKNQTHLCANSIEIERGGNTFTIDTLKTLAQANPEKTYLFIMGTDNLAGLNLWQHWEQLLDYCHLIVVNRAGYELTAQPWLQQFLNLHLTQDTNDLLKHKAGQLFLVNLEPYSISASTIRKQIADKQTSPIEIPSEIINFISKNNLYAKID